MQTSMVEQDGKNIGCLLCLMWFFASSRWLSIMFWAQHSVSAKGMHRWVCPKDGYICSIVWPWLFHPSQCLLEDYTTSTKVVGGFFSRSFHLSALSGFSSLLASMEIPVLISMVHHRRSFHKDPTILKRKKSRTIARRRSGDGLLWGKKITYLWKQ